MKKFVTFLILMVLLAFAAKAAVINTIRVTESANNVRLVIVLDSPVKYKVERQNSNATITMENAWTSPGVRKKFWVKNLDGIVVSQDGSTCEVRADFKYLTSSNVTVLKKPFRIIADFSKLSKMLIPRAEVPEIKKVSTSSTPEKFKIILSLTSFLPYSVSTTESGLIIDIPGMNSVIKNQKIVTKDKLISSILISQTGSSSVIRIAQSYPAFYQIYRSDSPATMVIEFDRITKSTLDLKEIVPGISYMKMLKGTEDGPSTVNVIIADPRSHDVSPYLASKPQEESNILGVIGSFFTFWVPNEETKYYKDTVRNMALVNKAVCGINGTYFGSQGEPLGVLMLNGELVSYSINDRTAMIISKDNRCYIDNVSLYGEASIDGSAVPITGINTKRRTGNVIVYTPRFGGQTDEDDPGTILSVIRDEVKNMSRVRGWIPADGYALSIDQSYYEKISSKIKPGDRIQLSLKMLPLSSAPDLDIKHIIGGGPRLLKAGVVYISKNSEKFKNDIANSRASRTAVGITKDGLLAFVTVDKCRQTAAYPKSAGATLDELAQIMRDIGCVDAMNLDGGGSSTMVINSAVVNSPSNGRETPVSNSILVK